MLLSGLHTWRRLIRFCLSRNTAHSRRKDLHQRRSRFDVAAMVEQLEDRTLLSAGSLDTSFSDDRKVTTDVGRQVPSHDRGQQVVAYQSDGKVLVVGYSHQAGSLRNDFAVTRYTVGEDLDPSFGLGGIVTIDFGGTDDYGYGITIDSADRVLVGGYSYQSGTGVDFAVARLTVDGTLDENFSGDGKQTIDFGSTSDHGLGVSVDSSNRVLVSGWSYQGNATNYDFAVARLIGDTNQAPSITSGGGGATTSLSIEENTTAVTDVDSSDPDGETENGGGLAYSLSGLDASLFSIDAAGILAFSVAPDFEAPGDVGNNNVYDVTVTVTDTGSLTDVQSIAVTVTNVTATISGTVFVDANGNGLFDGGTETAIDGVTVELLTGAGVLLVADVTELGGVYAFTVDDEFGTYRIRETQPTGVDDGAAILGDANGNGITGEPVVDGSVLSTNEMQLVLAA